MEQMLNNPKDFDRLNENPLKKLKSSSFKRGFGWLPSSSFLYFYFVSFFLFEFEWGFCPNLVVF